MSTAINPVNRAEAIAFLRRYTENRWSTAQYLAVRGRVVAPCDCSWDGCIGWEMIPASEGRDGIPVADLIDEAFPKEML